MKIGVFDSGLGGLAIARAIMSRLPEYDYLYLGDTKRVPYGNRSQATIHEFTAEALRFLFANDCQLVILACNTASAEALRKSQQEYLPVHYPDRRVLGVLIPAVESALEMAGNGVVGVLATASTIESRAYEIELQRQRQDSRLVASPAPLLVPLVENDALKYAQPMLLDYLAPFRNDPPEAIILGCTHYCMLKAQIRSMTHIPVVSPDEIVPEKLADYLERHPEIESKLGRNGVRKYLVTDLPVGYQGLVRRLSGEDLELELVSL